MIDLAKHEADLRDYEPERFDETDEMHIGAVAPYELREPLMELLACRMAFKSAERYPLSDEAKALLQATLMKDLDKLYRACVERFRDL